MINVTANRNVIMCFVCDQKVNIDKVNLATSLATHSKVTLPEKISQLIGDDYVVAVTEHDCVCKRCASLLNHMDKLENELTLVKRALISNISHKYKINFTDGTLIPQNLPNGGLKSDSTSDQEGEIRKDSVTTDALATKKKTTLTPTKTTPAKPLVKPAENVTKLRIYKCGFCSYQSKELANVRMHMKIHNQANKPETNNADGDKTNTFGSSLIPPKNPMSIKRRVFRCQVCSASFDDRNKCLEHISRDHTAAGRKLLEQKQSQEQKEAEKSDAGTMSGSESSDLAGQTTQADSIQGMDTADPPAITFAACTNNFGNEVEFKNEVDRGQTTKMEVDDAKSEGEYSQVSTTGSGTTSQSTADDEANKDGGMGLDIEAMIAALHSEGPENSSESMPNL